MPPASTWFEFPSPFATAPGSVLLADPPQVNVRKLRAMLLDETYPKPFVIDDGELLTLYFNIRLIQSVMRLDTPNTLELRYTRKMMCFLLFNLHPERIALIGMGGGSLVKFCHHHLPSCHLTAIELDEDVIAFRDIFKLPPDGPRLQVLHTDGADYLAKAKTGIDVLLVDAFDKTGVAPALASREFFEAAFDKLSTKGQFIINLAGDKRRFRGTGAR
jgi:spermidine synthase